MRRWILGAFLSFQQDENKARWILKKKMKARRNGLNFYYQLYAYREVAKYL